MLKAEVILGTGQLVIALFLAWIAWQQHNLAEKQKRLDKLRYKHELYERRFAVYRATFSFIAQMVREARPETSAQMKFYHDTADCDFLFGPEIRRYIDDLYRIANELRGANPEQDAEMLMFFGDQLKAEGIKERFASYLNLHEQAQRFGGAKQWRAEPSSPVY